MRHCQQARTAADVGMIGSPGCCMRPHRAHLLAEEEEEEGVEDRLVETQKGTLQALGMRVGPLADDVLQLEVDQQATFLAVACERLWAVEHLYPQHIYSAIYSLFVQFAIGPLYEGDGHGN
jgi:hypothetical protein